MLSRERHSPEWRNANRQLGEWRSRPTAGNRQTCRSPRNIQNRRKALDTKHTDKDNHKSMDRNRDQNSMAEVVGLA
jgi:hypothetical protein